MDALEREVETARNERDEALNKAAHLEEELEKMRLREEELEKIVEVGEFMVGNVVDFVGEYPKLLQYLFYFVLICFVFFFFYFYLFCLFSSTQKVYKCILYASSYSLKQQETVLYSSSCVNNFLCIFRLNVFY